MDFGLESGFISIDFGHETSGRLTPLNINQPVTNINSFNFFTRVIILCFLRADITNYNSSLTEK